MMDISGILTSTMKDKQCSSLCAFLLIEAGEQGGVHICKSESVTESNGRLRDKSSKSSDKKGLGNNLSGNNSTGLYDARYAVF